MSCVTRRGYLTRFTVKMILLTGKPVGAPAPDHLAPECRTPRLELCTWRWVVRPVTDLKRRVAPFQVVTDMVPAGDQPQAIAEISRRIRAGDGDTVLLG